jgi:AcrR family transcriptional regulator
VTARGADAEADERARLIRAAWTVLGRSGFEGFKVQLLLRETGLSARTFYRHFSDKNELFLTLMSDEYARVGRRVTAALARVDGPDERVVAWVREIVLAADEPKRAARARLFTSQPAVVRRFAEELAAASRAILDPLAESIAAGKAAGLFPWANADRDPLLIHDLAGAAMSSALGRAGSAEDMAAAVADFVLRALGAVPPPPSSTAGSGRTVVRRGASSRGGTAPRRSPA